MTSYLRSSPSCPNSIGYSACSIERASVVPGFSVFVWTGEYDLKTLRVDAYFFENGEKNFRFQKYPDTCGQGLNESDLGQIYSRMMKVLIIILVGVLLLSASNPLTFFKGDAMNYISCGKKSNPKRFKLGPFLIQNPTQSPIGNFIHTVLS